MSADEDRLLKLQEEYFDTVDIRKKEKIFNEMYKLIVAIATKMIGTYINKNKVFIDRDIQDEHAHHIAYRVLLKLFHRHKRRTGFTPIIYLKVFELLCNKKQRRWNEESYNYIYVGDK